MNDNILQKARLISTLLERYESAAARQQDLDR